MLLLLGKVLFENSSSFSISEQNRKLAAKQACSQCMASAILFSPLYLFSL